MFGTLLGLEKVVARNFGVGPDDARRTKRALGRLGLMKGDKFADNEFPTAGMFEGLKSFQRDSGLRVDGVMRPGGPTERLLANAGRRPAPLGFGGSVGPSRPNRRADVTRARRALAATGHLDGTAGGTAGADLTMAIQSFQRDFNLARDGVIDPGGPTDRALGRVVSPTGALVARQPERPRPPGAGTPIIPPQARQPRPAGVRNPAPARIKDTPGSTRPRRNLLEPASAKANEPDSAIADFDGGGSGSHGDQLKIRKRSRGILEELRDISEKGTKLSPSANAEMLKKIEQAFPHEVDRQRGMKSLFRASQMDRKRNIAMERAFLNKTEADQNSPDRLRKLAEIDRFHARFNGEILKRLYAKRGELWPKVGDGAIRRRV